MRIINKLHPGGLFLMDKGIIVAGNLIVDLLKKIDIYPDSCNLTSIRAVSRSSGGLVNNCIVDFARIDPSLPLKAVGRIGDDEYGAYILENLHQYKNIDTSAVKVEGQTSFTDVMYDSVRRTRAYFQFRGANADFGVDDFDFDKLEGDLLHIGYILLLDALDSTDDEYGTRLARVLAKAKAKGIKTSIDVVSEESDRYETLVRPSLKYLDYCIINEAEAGKITGVKVTKCDGTVDDDAIPEVCRRLRGYGVSDWIVIHARDNSYGLDKDGTYYQLGALDIPRSLIKGTTGAGDAFCTGVLLGAYRGMDLLDAMKLGTAVASCAILEPGASDGVRDFDATMALYNSYPEPALKVTTL
jgi:Sugar kinases, ribokinase family